MHEHQLYPFDLGARCCQLTNDLVAKLGDYGLAKSLFPEDYLSLEISLDAHKRFEGRTILKPFHKKFREIKTFSQNYTVMYLFSRIIFLFLKLCFVEQFFVNNLCIVYLSTEDHSYFSFNAPSNNTSSSSSEINSQNSLQYLPLRWLAPEVRQRILKEGRSFTPTLQSASENIWSIGITLW